MEGTHMSFWQSLSQYVLTSTGTSLGPTDVFALIISVFGAIGGTALIVLPKELTSRSATRRGPADERREIGRKERELRAELRVKVGTGMIVWSGALILSLLLRLLGTPGLMTRLLPAFVIAVLPILLGYVVVYRLFFYPRYLKEYRRIDTRKTYEPEVKKGDGKKAGAQTPRKAKDSLMPNKALIGLILVPLVYYVVMAFIAIPPGVPPA